MFDNLRDVRGLEYELDFVTNRASRDIQVMAHIIITFYRPVGSHLRLIGLVFR